MRKKVRLITFLLCISLLTNTFSVRIFAQEVENQSEISNVSPVTFMVELDDEPIISIYNETEEVEYEQFLQSNYVKEKTRILLDEQKKVSDEIKEKVTDSSEVCKYQYTNIMNGFSVQANVDDIEKIRNIDGVKNVYISKQYVPCESETTEIADTTEKTDTEETLDSVEEGHVDNTITYKGTGTVISVIDTGIDIQHECFKEEISETKLTEAEVNNMQSLNASNCKYYNSRFPFCYDYADNDDDIVPSEEFANNLGFHGTAVSSILVDNSKDVQILGMKVFSDKGGVGEEATVLAAIEDSIRLGADVINLSIGSVSGFSTPSYELENEVYTKVKELGIEVTTSAGNYYNSYLANSFNGYGMSSNPDNATMCEPASFINCTAVAASNSDNKVLDMSSWGVSPNLELKPERLCVKCWGARCDAPAPTLTLELFLCFIL